MRVQCECSNRKSFRSASDRSNSWNENPKLFSSSSRHFGVGLLSSYVGVLLLLLDCVFFLLLAFLLVLVRTTALSVLFCGSFTEMVPMEFRFLRETRIMPMIFVWTFFIFVTSFDSLPLFLCLFSFSSTTSSGNGTAGMSTYSHPKHNPCLMSHQSPSDRLYSRTVTTPKLTDEGTDRFLGRLLLFLLLLLLLLLIMLMVLRLVLLVAQLSPML